ncbi:hypothetical protein [Marinobacterium sp. MBR-109]|jgi:hypothetical protein|uniref:hypothetical protein n=1 Tax=Marinobacterium sp. MBR-109 TaxID=3156462 RepID=UPI0033947A74
MTILSTDIKLMASERLTDNEDGGGQMSAVEIQDGVVNNLFPDISRLDRTYGRVNLRKLYLAVRTANQDIYYGSHAIVTDPPDDPRVSTLIFSTGSYTDERIQARDRIESYVVRGIDTQYTVYGDQIEGQRTVKLYANLDAPLPDIGEVYLLSEEDAVSAPIGETQYVRVTDVTHEINSFEDEKGIYYKRVIELQISDPLRRRFPGGSTPHRVHTQNQSPTRFRNTVTADAANYYGIVPLQEPIQPGDYNVRCSTIFGQLVPSATAESAVADAQAGSDRPNIVRAGSSYTVQIAVSEGVSRTFGHPVLPGSVQVNSYVDDRAGVLRDGTGAQRGSIDYASGTISGLTGLSGTVSFTATPAAALYDAANTDRESIKLSNRGYNYIRTLRPLPQPGSLAVDYMSQGNWYRMQDNGKGELSDNQGGAGTIDYTTGTVVVTLGALPDVDSQVIYTWATPVTYERLSNLSLDIKEPSARKVLAAQTEDRVLVPGTVTFTWDSGNKTASDNGNGLITGDATGEVIYSTREVRIVPNVAPPPNNVIQCSYSTAEKQAAIYNMPTRDTEGKVTVVLASNLQPGTVRLAWNTDLTIPPDIIRVIPANVDPILIARDSKGDGKLYLDSGDQIGTVNYSTGSVTFTPDTVVPYPTRVYTQQGEDGIPVFTGIQYVSAPQIAPPDFDLAASFAQVDPGSSATDDMPLSGFEIDLTPYTLNTLVPGSVVLSLLGRTYVDRDGLLYSNIDYTTGSGLQSGSIDYLTGKVTLTDWNAGASTSLVLRSALTRYGKVFTNNVYFRTPGAPIRVGSLYFRANLPDGTLISGISNEQGVIDTPEMQGDINYVTGVINIDFGAWVQESTLTAEEREQSWYSAANIQADGTIWVPAQVDPDSMKFNAVVLSQMPLSANILGLDPVRLPVDGRVPIIRSGDVVVVHSTQTDTLPNPVSAGQTITLSRDQLASVVLEDSEGTKLDAALYTTNRETGTVTLADPLDLSAYTQPLQAKHRVEDMALVNEAQINGQISLVGGISRAYDPADTWVSSALIFGDLGSRVHHQFSQATWTGEWADERVGDNTTAQYNDLLYPIQVDNKNSIRERWALIFTSSTSFNIVGEVSGVIGTGNTSADCTPINPTTGEPYFIVLAAGWGSGWATNNVLRFNTDAAHAPIWVARTTVSGAATHNDDSFKIEARGDAD